MIVPIETAEKAEEGGHSNDLRQADKGTGQQLVEKPIRAAPAPPLRLMQ